MPCPLELPADVPTIAAKSIGVPVPVILLRHLVPNLVGPVLVVATLTVPAVMLEEAFLSFLGLGVQPPTPSWGSIMSVGRNYIGSAWWIATLPGIALFLVVLSVNVIGDHMRDRFDPRSISR